MTLEIKLDINGMDFYRLVKILDRLRLAYEINKTDSVLFLSVSVPSRSSLGELKRRLGIAKCDFDIKSIKKASDYDNFGEDSRNKHGSVETQTY